LLRLRRTAHQHHRRGTCGSPCPQSLRSFAGSTPSGGYRPPLRRPPQTFNNRGVLLQATKRALAQDPKGQSRARSGGRFACKSFDATATAPAGRNASRSPQICPLSDFEDGGDAQAPPMPKRSLRGPLPRGSIGSPDGACIETERGVLQNKALHTR